MEISWAVSIRQVTVAFWAAKRLNRNWVPHLLHHSAPSLPTTTLPFLQEGKKIKRCLHTRSHPPDARIRRGLTEPPQGAPREMKPPMY